MSLSLALMSVTAISVELMSSTVITYHRDMGRWEPNARGRLAQAALALYVEQGFDETTVAQIAARAGLSERTFFRHFEDKREVLFYGMEHAQVLLTKAVREASPSSAPMDAVGSALEAVCSVLQQDPDRVRLREAVVSSKAELRERELIKLAAFASTVAEALRERGVPEPVASLAAEQGVAIFKVAFTLWVRGRGQSLLEILRESMHEAKGVIEGQPDRRVAGQGSNPGPDSTPPPRVG